MARFRCKNLTLTWSNDVPTLCEFCTEVTTLVSNGSSRPFDHEIVKNSRFEDSAKWCNLCANIDKELRTDVFIGDYTVRGRTPMMGYKIRRKPGATQA
jgi:hypothetical protein